MKLPGFESPPGFLDRTLCKKAACRLRVGSVVKTLSPPSILGLRTQVRPVRRSVLSMRQVAYDFSAVRGLIGYAVLLTTPPKTYQGTERLSGKV